jgi:hypothetical protein
MSKKDGKAILLQSKIKKGIYILPIHATAVEENRAVAKACPVRIIKVSE